MIFHSKDNDADDALLEVSRSQICRLDAPIKDLKMIFVQNQIYITYINIYDQDCKTETELNLPQLQTRYFLSIHLRSSRASWEEGHRASFRVSSATSSITTRGRHSHSPQPRLS